MSPPGSREARTGISLLTESASGRKNSFPEYSILNAGIMRERAGTPRVIEYGYEERNLICCLGSRKRGEGGLNLGRNVGHRKGSLTKSVIKASYLRKLLYFIVDFSFKVI